ncbi:FeoB-associated Cys-rich membrane protein [Desulfonema magnum]|uniref:FeoB-associated Cys-rich membrane protein n=1 Tax=Desulfonema magnum TaxID=45655 RepID=A0A975BKZ0_9BACT|nr:FeoB-associated Cys-rich membrane protein [Desulfonema magnum]QTA87010.1 Uncharacterized protein dnm_030370 [Desulfonema magnum]
MLEKILVFLIVAWAVAYVVRYIRKLSEGSGKCENCAFGCSSCDAGESCDQFSGQGRYK